MIEGSRGGRRQQRRHELLPRHQTRDGVLAADFEEGPAVDPGLNHPVSGTTRSPTARGTTPRRPTTARRGGCISTARSNASARRSVSRRAPTASSTRRSAARSTSTGAARRASSTAYRRGAHLEPRADARHRSRPGSSLEIPQRAWAARALGPERRHRHRRSSTAPARGNTGTIVGSAFAWRRRRAVPEQSARRRSRRSTRRRTVRPAWRRRRRSASASAIPDGDPMTVTFFGRPVPTGVRARLHARRHPGHAALRGRPGACRDVHSADAVDRQQPRRRMNIAFVTHLGDIVEHIDASAGGMDARQRQPERYSRRTRCNGAWRPETMT